MNTRLTHPENHDKSLALELKPFRHIEALIKHVLPAAERVVIGRGDVVHYYKDDIRQCFLLLQGSVALHRRGDGIVLNSESAPFILGVSSQFSSEHLYVRALETSEIAVCHWIVLITSWHNWICGSIFRNSSFTLPPGCMSIAHKSRRCQLMTSSAFSLLNSCKSRMRYGKKLRLQPILRAEPIFHGAGLCEFWPSYEPGSTSPWNGVYCLISTICLENTDDEDTRDWKPRYNQTGQY